MLPSCGQLDPTEVLPPAEAAVISSPSNLFTVGYAHLPAKVALRDEWSVEYTSLVHRQLRCEKVKLMSHPLAADIFVVGKEGASRKREVWKQGI